MQRKGPIQPDGAPQRDDDGAGGAHEQQIERLFQEHNREIAQEAYVRLLRLDEPDAVSYLRSYLFRIAANLATDRLKQRERRGELRALIFFDKDLHSPPPETGLNASEELALIRAAIEELPVNCRTAFLLHKIHEVPVADTAERMQLSIRMVTQQALSRDVWDETLVWMVEEQGMEPMEDGERVLVLDYLEKHYGQDARRKADGGS